jgi:inner membrane transporter RhtA
VILVLMSSTSIQFGTAVAVTAFAAAGPLGALSLRDVAAALIMAAWVRPKVRGLRVGQVRAVVPYAVALAVMLAAIYLALAKAPLGVISAILMLGPLTVSALGSRSLPDLVAVAIAAVGVGVLALSEGTSGSISPIGIALALVAATAFGAYIHTGKAVAGQFDGLDGVAIALLLVAVMHAPLGLAFGRDGIWKPASLLALTAAGLLAAAVPFSLELTALRNLSAPTFGLLLSFEPAIAALAGFLVRGQALTLRQLGGIGLVIVATAIGLGPRQWTRRIGSYNRVLMSDPKVAALAKVALFSGLSARDLNAIASVAKERHAPAGQILTEQGAPGVEFFIIADGEVEIRIDGRQVNRLGPGDHLGEIALLLDVPRTATAVTTRPSLLYVLAQDDFATMLRAHPRIEDKVLRSVSERMRYR